MKERKLFRKLKRSFSRHPYSSRVYLGFFSNLFHLVFFLYFNCQTTNVPPCKGLSCFLVASGGVRPIKVALFHLHANSRHCRQQASLASKGETKLSAIQSQFGGQNIPKRLLIISVYALSIHLQKLCKSNLL